MTTSIEKIKKYFFPAVEISRKFIIKDCFVCKTRGHILSHRQLARLKAECMNKRGQVNWKMLERKLEDPKIQCNVCHGEGELIYPHI